MKKLKTMTVVGTRPEIIKLSRVIAELRQHTEHVLVHTGQNYSDELNEVFFRDLKIEKPDYYLEAATDNLAQSIGNIIAKADAVFEKEQPQAVLFYGDTNSCLAAIAAKRRKIPLFHMEAGNRCFDQRVPEEINRKIIDHISDINMPLSEHARRYLIAEGLKPETIIKIGSPLQEVYQYHWKDIQASTILDRLHLKAKDYFIVSAHREENVDKMSYLQQLLSTLNTIAETYNKRIIVSTHPRTRARLESFFDNGKSVQLDPRIEFMTAFGLLDYIKLQLSAFCILSDSGSITEDASILNIPAVTIRDAHERPEGMDVGTLVMCGLKAERVMQAIEIVVSHHDQSQRAFALVPDYEADNVSKKVLRIITSYIDYINQTVWREY